MAEKWNKIRIKCTPCGGTGIEKDWDGGTCRACGGTGYSDTKTELEVTDIISKLNNIKSTVDDIWDKVK